MDMTMKLFGISLKKKSRSKAAENGRSGGSSHGSSHGSSGCFSGFYGSPASPSALQEYQEKADPRFNFTPGNLTLERSSSGSGHESAHSPNGIPLLYRADSRLSSPKGLQQQGVDVNPSNFGRQVLHRRSFPPETELLDRNSRDSVGVHPAHNSNGAEHIGSPHSAHERSPFSSERAASQAFPGLTTSQTQAIKRPPLRTMTLGDLGSTHVIEGVHALARQRSEPRGCPWQRDEDSYPDLYESQFTTPASQSPPTDWTDNNSRVSPVDLSGASTPQRSPKGHHQATQFSPVQELHPLPTPPPFYRNFSSPNQISLNGILSSNQPIPQASSPRSQKFDASGIPSNQENVKRVEQDARDKMNEPSRSNYAHESYERSQRSELIDIPTTVKESARPFVLPSSHAEPQSHCSQRRSSHISPHWSPHASPHRSPCRSPRQGSPQKSPSLSPILRGFQSPRSSSQHTSTSPHPSHLLSPDTISLCSRRPEQLKASQQKLLPQPAHDKQAWTPTLSRRSPQQSAVNSPLQRSPRRSPQQSAVNSPLQRSPQHSPPASPGRLQQLEVEPLKGWRLLSVDRSPSSAPSPPKRWTKGQVLGNGSFGTVYEAWNLDDGSFFAVKVSDKDTVAPEVQQEVAMLSKLRHPNIVQYLGTSIEDNNLCIFLELVKMGSLQSIMKKYHHFNEMLIRTYTRQILKGLEYLHAKNIVHRDIKCANILVDCSGQVKLADFGLAKLMNRSLATSFKGTPFYMAPEVMQPVRNNRIYGLAVDIWSLGCTVIEMAQGKPPWSDLPGMAFFFKVSKGELPPIPVHLSDEAKHFIRQCLQLDPGDRPTASELLEHSFVANAPSTVEEVSSDSGTSGSLQLNNQRREITQQTARDPSRTSIFSTTRSGESSSSSSREEDYYHGELSDPQRNHVGHFKNFPRPQSNPSIYRLRDDSGHQVHHP